MAERDYAVMLERAHLTAVTSAQWRKHQAQAQRLDVAIEANLARLGFEELTSPLASAII